MAISDPDGFTARVEADRPAGRVCLKLPRGAPPFPKQKARGQPPRAFFLFRVLGTEEPMLTDELNAIEAEAGRAVADADSSEALDRAQVEYLGRSGRLTGCSGASDRFRTTRNRCSGQALNQAKERLTEAIALRRDALSAREREARERAETLDVYLPGRARPSGRLHPLSRTEADIKRVMIGLGFEFVDGPDIESYAFNFEWLNYPPDHRPWTSR
jgi:phenylalanyl-tRNA synthetase alpha chain